jgi:hypothetical protein
MGAQELAWGLAARTTPARAGAWMSDLPDSPRRRRSSTTKK